MWLLPILYWKHFSRIHEAQCIGIIHEAQCIGIIHGGQHHHPIPYSRLFRIIKFRTTNLNLNFKELNFVHDGEFEN